MQAFPRIRATPALRGLSNGSHIGISEEGDASIPTPLHTAPRPYESAAIFTGCDAVNGIALA